MTVISARCEPCGHDFEVWYQRGVLVDGADTVCPKCNVREGVSVTLAGAKIRSELPPPLAPVPADDYPELVLF